MPVRRTAVPSFAVTTAVVTGVSTSVVDVRVSDERVMGTFRIVPG